MTSRAGRLIAVNALVSYARSLAALGLGLFASRWTLQAMGAGDFDAGSFLAGDEVLKKLPELVKEPEDGSVARLYRLPGAQGQVGLISPLSCQFCDRCDRIRLTADGRIKPCLHQQAEYAIKGLDEDGMLHEFEAAIRSKPPCHGELSYAAASRAGRPMNRIGG